MPVVDASVLIEYVGRAPRALDARARLLAFGHSLWVPHLVDAEVGHALRRQVVSHRVSARAARSMLDDFAAIPLRRMRHRGLLHRAWALRDGVSFYDGIYVALAERLGMPLLTMDARLARANGPRIPIEVL